MNKITVTYGNGVSDRHRWVFHQDGDPGWPTTPPSYTAPTGSPPSGTITFDVFLTWFWAYNAGGLLPTAYGITGISYVSIDVSSGQLGISATNLALGTGWTGSSTRNPTATQPGGYHCYTFQSSDARINRIYIFGSDMANQSRHLVDNPRINVMSSIFSNMGLRTSWKPQGAGRVNNTGLQPVVGFKPYISCGYNRRHRKHTLY